MLENQFSKYVTSHWDKSFRNTLSTKLQHKMCIKQVVACALYEGVDMVGTTSEIKQLTFDKLKRSSVQTL